MAEIATIARPYAEAAFRLARERKALSPWSEALHRLSQLVDDPAAAALIGNPNVAASAVEDLFRTAAAGDPEIGNLIRMLSENGRLTCLPEISTQFDAMKRGDEGVKEGIIYSAFPLDSSQLQQLKAVLEDRFGRLQLSVVESRDLIGGVKVVVGDQVLDASVSGKLAAMRAALNS
ncbi:MAG TPA: F0F1 ATP synthase subunit delta [Rhodocyclaceae bacterium]|nr:F0F1 ATP synthase subunit delta [Rhodocyclaceae bacterium]